MEKNVKTWHPRLNKNTPLTTQRPQMKSPAHLTLPTSSINNHMNCKELSISMLQLPSQLAINKWRYQTAYPIFRIYHFSYEPDRVGLAHTVLAKIVYELPDILLAEVKKSMEFDKFLYVMKTVLMACEKLVEKFGYFQVTDKMIGFTQEGCCKIWVNQNLWENEVMILVQDEEEAVEGIKQIMEQFLGDSEVQRNFLYLIREERHSFVKLVQQIWQFSYQNGILIPPYFQTQNKKPQKHKQAHKKTYSNLPSPRVRKDSIQQQRSPEFKKYQHRNTRQFCPQQFKNSIQNISPLKSHLSTFQPRSQFSNRLSQQYNVSKNRWSEFDAQNSHQSQTYLENTASNYTVNFKQQKMIKMNKNTVNLNAKTTPNKNPAPTQRQGSKTKTLANLQTNTSKTKLNLQKMMVTSPRKRGNSKSDFITRTEINQPHYENHSKIPSNICPQKQNVSVIKPYTNSQEYTMHLEPTTTTNMKTSENPSENTSSTSTTITIQNKQKMKNMIKQKIRINREKKKVVKLQAINTVKSIGQFTQSQKRILEQSQDNSVLININLEMLQRMCQKIGTSYLHIQVPNDSQDGDNQRKVENIRATKDKQHRRNGRIY